MTWFIVFAAALAILILLFTRKAKLKSGATEEQVSRRVGEIERQIAALESQLAADLADSSVAGRRPLPLDDDPQEPVPAFFDRAMGRALAVDLIIDYRDAEQRDSTRRITTRSYQYTPTDGLIDAYCHQRRVGRSFLFSRIMGVFDPATGKVVENLRGWLDDQYERTPGAIIDRLLGEHWDALNCLQHIAKADGAFRGKERDIARDFLVRNAPDAEPQTIDAVIAELIKWYQQSAISFGKHLRQLATSPEGYKQDVIAAAEAMVGSDKTTHTAELNALKRLKKELRPS